jgi:uncharacterized protein
MRALLDVNVLIALLDAGHSMHERATSWFQGEAEHGWASCPITQNGCIRVMTNPAYANPLPAAAIVERLREATLRPEHGRIHGHRQITDTYLLALARRRHGRFVSFDHGISIEAVQGASPGDLVLL